MIAAEARPWYSLRLPPGWPWAFYAALNIGLAIHGLQFSADNVDWQLWSMLPEAIAADEVYSINPGLPFVWSPVAAWLMAGVSFIGYGAWVVAHVAAVFLLDRRMIALTLLSWPFWVDAALGNTVTFAFVAGIRAARGNRLAGLAYLALFLLIPRPLQGPLALWLLWKQPGLRLPFAALFLVHAALVLMSGDMLAWFDSALEYGAVVSSIGPPAWFGLWWFAAALLVAPWLIARGMIGTAGLMLSPYWLPYYLFWPLIDLRGKDREASITSDVRFPSRTAGAS